MLEESLDSVRAELDDVTSASGVSDGVGLDAKLCVTISRV